MVRGGRDSPSHRRKKVSMAATRVPGMMKPTTELAVAPELGTPEGVSTESVSAVGINTVLVISIGG